MNRPKVTEKDYINVLIATPKLCSSTEAARVHPEGGRIVHLHRSLKQFCGVERAQVRAARAQRNHM